MPLPPELFPEIRPEDHPGLVADGRCPVTGRLLWTRPEWNVANRHYANRLQLVAENVVLASSSGHIRLDDTRHYLHRFDLLAAEFARGGRKLHLIEDWSRLRGAETSARRLYVGYHIGHGERLETLLFHGLNPLTRVLVALGRSLHPYSFRVAVLPNLPACLEHLAGEEPGESSGSPERRHFRIPLPRRLLAPHVERLARLFAEIPWGRDGEGENPLPDDDPFHDLVDGWIAIKADLDQLQRRNQQQQDDFRAIMQSAREGVWITDAQGRTLWTNAGMARLLETEPEALADRRLADLLPDGILELPEGDAAPLEVEIPFPAGSRWLRISLGRTPRGVFALCADITDRKLAEERTRRQNEELEARVRERTRELTEALRAREQFLAVMSHELRTPLASMLSIAEAMAAGLQGPLTPSQRSRLELLETNGDHLLALINDVLDLTKSLAGRLALAPEPTDLVALCKAATETLRPTAESRGQHLGLELPDIPLVGHLDPLRLRQILLNLLSNASKFSPPGTTVRLRLERLDETRRVRLTVADEGPGIAPEDQVRLFQPFVQIDSSLSRAHGGTGLGLALSRELARAHGGEIRLESIPGEGSSFVVEIPWLPCRDPSDDAPSSGGVEPLDCAFTVLLVEDNDDLRLTLGEYLEDKGWDVRYAAGGRGALEIFSLEPASAVVMDIQMPGMDGLECIRRLRGLPGGAQARIAAVSGLAFPEDQAASREAGADLHLAKPVRMAELHAHLRQLCREAERSC